MLNSVSRGVAPQYNATPAFKAREVYFAEGARKLAKETGHLDDLNNLLTNVKNKVTDDVIGSIQIGTANGKTIFGLRITDGTPESTSFYPIYENFKKSGKDIFLSFSQRCNDALNTAIEKFGAK